MESQNDSLGSKRICCVHHEHTYILRVVACRASGRLRRVVVNGFHGDVESVAANDLVHMGRRSDAGLDQRVDAVDNELRALETHHSGAALAFRHEAVGRTCLSILRREGKREGKRLPVHDGRAETLFPDSEAKAYERTTWRRRGAEERDHSGDLASFCMRRPPMPIFPEFDRKEAWYIQAPRILCGDNPSGDICSALSPIGEWRINCRRLSLNCSSASWSRRIRARHSVSQGEMPDMGIPEICRIRGRS